VAMIFEIISNLHDQQVSVDIVKNIPLDGTRHPYQADGIVSRELDADDWHKNKETGYVLGVVKPSSKRNVRQYFSEHFAVGDEEYPVLVHPETSIATKAGLEKGVIVNPGTVIAPYCMVESFVSINRNVSLGHHTRIGAFTQINPAANIAGRCTIGENVVISMGAIIFDGVSIGDNTIIGAGAVVTKNIPGNVVAWGNPARVIRDL
jgi:sugar O-acyltransferase (sialic acid O-acetyltransferase NeuD family)